MTVKAFWMWSDEFIQRYGRRYKYDVICCAIDSEPACARVARFAVQTTTPAVFTAVSWDGDGCRIFIQRPGEACFGCYRPQSVKPPSLGEERTRCIPSPAIADILHVAVGFSIRALVGEILGDPIGRDWNCRDITLSGISIKQQIERKAGCPVCTPA
jgi:hypothetical protein